MDLEIPFPLFDDYKFPLYTSIMYLTLIFFLYKWMEKRNAMKLNIILGIHNLFLCLLSIVMFVGFLRGIVLIYQEDGLLSLYCGSSTKNNEIMLYWASIFYLSKYYELLDTVFVILRKKQLTLLHVWHHFSVLYACWLATHERLMMGWISAFINCFVHILMYYYYSIQSFSRREIWWRKYITSIQIFQFITDLLFSLLFIYIQIFTEYECLGSWRVWMITNFIGITFLYLFIDLYRKEYLKKLE
jgi:hypothetical protein